MDTQLEFLQHLHQRSQNIIRNTKVMAAKWLTQRKNFTTPTVVKFLKKKLKES